MEEIILITTFVSFLSFVGSFYMMFFLLRNVFCGSLSRSLILEALFCMFLCDTIQSLTYFVMFFLKIINQEDYSIRGCKIMGAITSFGFAGSITWNFILSLLTFFILHGYIGWIRNIQSKGISPFLLCWIIPTVCSAIPGIFGAFGPCNTPLEFMCGIPFDNYHRLWFYSLCTIYFFVSLVVLGSAVYVFIKRRMRPTSSVARRINNLTIGHNTILIRLLTSVFVFSIIWTTPVLTSYWPYLTKHTDPSRSLKLILTIFPASSGFSNFLVWVTHYHLKKIKKSCQCCFKDNYKMSLRWLHSQEYTLDPNERDDTSIRFSLVSSSPSVNRPPSKSVFSSFPYSDGSLIASCRVASGSTLDYNSTSTPYVQLPSKAASFRVSGSALEPYNSNSSPYVLLPSKV